ncbi:MAG: type II secretion system major pseudopilin GspG [Phycisphaerales bacterium]|nr:MAG: type II secretion system major pseudopilin GspG [Phycisphaerales bacterium]
MKRKNRNRKAFTLVELLVVVLIITMLAAFVTPKLFTGIGRTKAELTRAKMAIIENALARFYIDCGRYPDDSEGLEVLIIPPADMEEGKWNGPYLKQSDLVDLWENPYIYVAEGEVNPGTFDLVSLGQDGVEGGEDDNADIVNE